MDIGGTNLRLAYLDSSKALTNIESWSCNEFSGPADVLTRYIEKYSLEEVSLCIAIASPSDEDQVTMTNLDWSFSRLALQEQLSLAHLSIINDYHAMGLAIPLLSDTEKVKVGSGTASPDKSILICGPGTGLGVAILTKVDNKWLVLPGEGGHMDLAPNTPYEQKIWEIFHRKYGHVSSERILSGPGLEELHAAICTIDGIAIEPWNAKQIVDKGMTGASASCEKTLHIFCAMLGSFCGSLALATASFGGVYIAGGVVHNFLDFFNASEFRKRFEDKGRYRSYNERIPSYVVTAKFPGLLGAAEHLSQNSR
ncbi:glucokinase [Gammaproteobacteria bacterium AH-315-E17]|nr:glucokinase [Gammaproteobacteria bacterium AH-315-E17]